MTTPFPDYPSAFRTLWDENEMLKIQLANAKKRIEKLEKQKTRLLSTISIRSDCPGNGWKYDFHDGVGCYPVEDEFIGTSKQCRACWEAALEAENE